MKNCPKCKGQGTAKSGRDCPACQGQGQVSEERFKELHAILKGVYQANNERKNTWAII